MFQMATSGRMMGQSGHFRSNRSPRRRVRDQALRQRGEAPARRVEKRLSETLGSRDPVLDATSRSYLGCATASANGIDWSGVSESEELSTASIAGRGAAALRCSPTSRRTPPGVYDAKARAKSCSERRSTQKH